MNCKSLSPFLAAAALGWMLQAADRTTDKPHKLTTVSVRKMADSLHAVIAADRQSYAELIGQRLATDEQRPPGSAASRESQSLPSHAQMLRHAADSLQKQGAEFSYTLRSLWPIHPSSGPQTEAEDTGLHAVCDRPEQPFYAEEELGGRSYFTAVYSDRATAGSCASCHNRDPRSPKHDFREGDVMGAIVVRVPLEF
ncbi:MAG: DUF3365 domain-containing protein [Verrucomicrobiota bacterium]